jgi:hypothetical protein
VDHARDGFPRPLESETLGALPGFRDAAFTQCRVHTGKAEKDPAQVRRSHPNTDSDETRNRKGLDCRELFCQIDCGQFCVEKGDRKVYLDHMEQEDGYQRKFRKTLLYHYLMLFGALVVLSFLYVAVPLFFELRDICSLLILLSVVATGSIWFSSFWKSRNEPLVEITEHDLIINDVSGPYPRENTDNKTIPLTDIEGVVPRDKWASDILLKDGKKVLLPVLAVKKSDRATLVPSIEEAIKLAADK